MKKLIYLIGMLFLFSSPILAHAEKNPDMSNLSDEQMIQELDKRLEEKTNDSAVQESKKEEQPITLKAETPKSFDIMLFKKTVDSMDSSRIKALIDTYAIKNELSEVEKEKFVILQDRHEELKEGYIKAAKIIVACFVIFVIIMIFLR